jgi:2-keto-3-deoxy-6-phosphogluconate aldolase
MSQIIQAIGAGSVPVVQIEHAKDAINLGKALLKATPCAEITFRSGSAKATAHRSDLTRNHLGAEQSDNCSGRKS